MINTGDQTVIVHIPISPVMVRRNGEDVKAFALAQGFCSAEYADGNVFPISNPLEQWLLDVTVNQGVTPGAGDQGQQVYFVFEAPGMPGNPGSGDENIRSVTDIQTGL